MPRTNEEKKREWEENIRNQQESGLSVKKWCTENKISFHNFSYWKKRLHPPVISRSSFVELTDQNDCLIDIRYRNVHIRFESASLKQFFEVIREFRC